MKHSPDQSSKTNSGDWKKLFLGAAVIFLLVFAVYWPAIHGEYLWDDETLVTENVLLRQPDGLKSIWFSTKPYDYFPLTLTSFWIEWKFWGLNSTGYHATNIAVHAFGAVLVWRVLTQLRLRGAFLAALIFAVHPVCVASVAWIAERKNVLSLVFFLLSLLFWLRSEERLDPASGKQESGGGASRFYALSLVTFLLALLSKTSVVMLPVVFLGIAWWRSGKITRKVLVRSVPFFGLSLVLGLVTIWFQSHRAIGGAQTDPLIVRVLAGGSALWFYLWKTIFPLNLAMIYPRWTPSPQSILSYLPWAAWMGLFALLWRFRATWGRPLLFALGFFAVTLFPVLGFFNMSFFEHSRVSDHLQHISMIGVIALVASVLTFWLETRMAANKMAVYGLSVLVIVPLAWLTFQRADVFSSSLKLWTNSVRVNPNGWGAYNNLGLALGRLGRRAEAIEAYRNSLKAKPDYPYAHNNLGLALADNKQFSEAMKHYEAALQQRPKYPEAHNNIGNVVLETGKLDDAISHYETALQLRPAFAQALNNLGYALSKKGRLPEAIGCYQRAISVDPQYLYPHNNLGRAFAAQNKYADAITEYRVALQIDPNHVDSRNGLAGALFELNKLPEAIAEYTTVLRLKPDHVDAHNSLGIAQAMSGNSVGAVRLFQRALELNPTNAFAMSNLGNVYAQQKNWSEAVKHYESALKLQPNDSATHSNLGHVLTEQGKIEAAYAHYMSAVKLDPADPRSHFNCGMSLVRQNRRAEAQRYFEEALRLNPAFAEAKQQLDMLAKSGKN